MGNDNVDRVAANQPTIFEDRHRDSGPTFCYVLFLLISEGLLFLAKPEHSSA